MYNKSMLKYPPLKGIILPDFKEEDNKQHEVPA
jgi:hypothetical protein